MEVSFRAHFQIVLEGLITSRITIGKGVIPLFRANIITSNSFCCLSGSISSSFCFFLCVPNVGFDKNRNCFLTAHHFMPPKKRRTLVWALGFNLSEGPLFYRTHTKKYQGTGRVETLNQILRKVRFMDL